MDDIRVPLKVGSLRDLDTETLSQGNDTDSPALDSLSSQDAKQIYAKEAKIQVDYSKLDSDLTEVREELLVFWNAETYVLYKCIVRLI